MLSAFALHFLHPENSLYEEKRRLENAGDPVADLVSGNVTRHGLRFPEDLLRHALDEGIRRTSIYAPDPMGRRDAREAISRWYAEHGAIIPAERLILTSGTSLSYAYLFRLLADSGDEILCPHPGYPLFDGIAALAQVKLRHYPLIEARGWRMDIDALARAVSPRTRAIVVISPHNPTGMVATQEELDGIAAIARRHGLAVIVDEVFCPFVFGGSDYPRLAPDRSPLVVTLNGFSKMLALPGVKIGWIGVAGDEDRVRQTLRGLDAVSDLFLPVSDPAQAAAPMLLEGSGAFQRHYRGAIAQRAEAAQEALKRVPGVTSALPEGGFYTTLRLEDPTDEETAALSILKNGRVLTHPGYFYDLGGSHLVISHVGEPDWTAQALKTVGRTIGFRSR